MSVNELQRSSYFTDVLTIHEIINSRAALLMEYVVFRAL